MKKEFREPIEAKQKKSSEFPWTFKAPPLDSRNSRKVAPGDDYGVGFNVPVGKESARPMSEGPIPQTSKCFSPDAVFASENKQG